MRKFKRTAVLHAALALAAVVVPGHAQSIYTPYAFTNFVGTPDVSGTNDGVGTGAQFYLPHGVALDNGGNLYVTDTQNYTIRQVTPAGLVTTIAGSPGNKGSADGVGFGAAQFNSPIGISADTSGNVYVGDTSNDTIRKITPAGVVTTLAGQAGIIGSVNANGTNALFRNPEGTAADSAGNVYVADNVNRIIRKISSAGDVITFAGTLSQQGTNDGTGTAAKFNQPISLAVDSATNLYVADGGSDTIRKITPGAVVTTLAGLGGQAGTNDGMGSAARFTNPQGVAVDAGGNVYVGDSTGQTIRKITPGGVVSTIAGTPGLSGNTDGTNHTALFSTPRGVAVDSATNVYVADSGNSTIRKLTRVGTNWVSSTIAGTAGQNGSVDGVGSAARFHFPYGLTVDSSGNLYAVDRSNDSIRKIAPSGTNWVVTTFAGVVGLVGSADGTGAAAQFDQPNSLAVDSSTNIYVADFGNHTVRKISPVGGNWLVSTLAGSPGVIGTNNGTGAAALFADFHGIAVDGAHNVYVTDTGNFMVRKITPGAVVTTLAGTVGQQGLLDGTGSAALFGGPVGVCSDAAGNLTVVDGYSIRQVSPAGVVTTISGCPSGGCTNAIGDTDAMGTLARFGAPIGITRDSSGNLYVADAGNDTIRKLTFSGGEWTVTTLAGLTGQTNTTDGVGSDARFNNPMGIAVDAAGEVYVSDSFNDRISKGVVASAPPPTVKFDTSTGSLTVSNGSFHLRLTGPSTGNLILYTSTNLTTWTPLQTNALVSGAVVVSVPLNQAPRRFFRALLGP